MTAQTFYETPKSISALPPYRVQLAAHIETSDRKAIRGDVIDALQRGHDRVEIDCSSWCDLDLAVLSALIQCAKACDQRAASFEMLNVRREIRTAIAALRLESRLCLSP